MDDRAHRVITHWQEHRLHSPSAGDSRSHLTEALPLAELLGAEQVSGEVRISQAEPGVGIVASQRLKTVERLIRQAPPFPLIDRAR